MKTKILFKFSFENGWGDTFLSIFDIVNCADFIKNKYPDISIELVINDENSVNTLQQVLNLNFFNKLFDNFEIVTGENRLTYIQEITTFKGTRYIRLYSGRNDIINNNINGIFDVFVPENEYLKVKDLNIPFLDYTFNNIDDRPKIYNIFNTEIVKKVKEFINDNFKGEFESIYYRCVPPLNMEKILKFKETLLEILDPTKEYFICSNASIVKELFAKTTLNLQMYRKLEYHDSNRISNGFTKYGQTVEEALFVVGELVILGESSLIYYSGDMSYVSLFNWYAVNVKKVKLKEIII